MTEGMGEGDGGFMLLEVMVSVAILGLAVAAAVQLFAGSLRLARASDDYTETVLLAREKMAEALLNETLEEGTDSGTDNGISWAVEVGEYGSPAPAAKDAAFAVYTVTVSAGRQGRRAGDFTLTTLRTVAR